MAANPNVVVANVSGNAYAMPWLDKVPAVLQSWYLGTMIGPAMADVISGKVNPSGKLPFSFPKRLEDNSAHHFGEVSYPGLETADAKGSADDFKDVDISGGNDPYQEYLDDILVGYRWHDTKKIPALFPFGYGLSYTDFSYGKPSQSAKKMTESETITVTVPVTNTGKVPGAEVVQLYISDDKASVLRPVKELKGFRKVFLQPGETQEVTFTVDADDLKYFDDKKHEWVAELGSFKALIGSSSADIRAKVPFSLTK